MQAEGATIRFMAGYQAIWFRNFPDLSRRAQWHIASHLSSKARDGAQVGELSGIVKQLFLLDDATVRERLAEFYRLGLCGIDPPDKAVSARTIIIPTPDLLNRFDAHLRELGQLLFAAVREIDPEVQGAPPAALDDESRRALLHAIETCNERCLAELDQCFAAMGISIARRLEAKRHLLSPSHWLLVQMTLERRYTQSHQSEDDEGVLADELAAELLKLLRQNMQTTRDHIAYLVQLGLMERCPGRTVRVMLAETTAVALHRALGGAAAELAEVAASIALQDDPSERTGVYLPSAVKVLQPRHVLTVTHPGEPERRTVLEQEPLVIGRAASSGLMLPANQVSRIHCRVELSGEEVRLTDLESTNGTFVDGQRVEGTIALQPGAVIQIGPYRAIYTADEVGVGADVSLSSQRP